MGLKRIRAFNPQTFLRQVGNGKTTLSVRKKQILFSQGDAADSIFYIQEGQVKLTVLSAHGKEAVIGVLEVGTFWVNPALPESLCAWRRQARWQTPRSSALTKPP